MLRVRVALAVVARECTAQSIVQPVEFADIAYARFSPAGDQIAFMVPQPVFDGSQPAPDARAAAWAAPGLGARTALESVAGGARRRPRGTSWPRLKTTTPRSRGRPDGSALLVYGGGGGYLVDPGSGTFHVLSFLVGYGSVAWLCL